MTQANKASFGSVNSIVANLCIYDFSSRRPNLVYAVVGLYILFVGGE